jgi:hypothetical protein
MEKIHACCLNLLATGKIEKECNAALGISSFSAINSKTVDVLLAKKRRLIAQQELACVTVKLIGIKQVLK